MFKTTDLALATALVTYNKKLVGLDKTNPKRVKFVFQDDVSELVDKFFSGSLKVDPLAYFNNLKALKTRIYSS